MRARPLVPALLLVAAAALGGAPPAGAQSNEQAAAPSTPAALPAGVNRLGFDLAGVAVESRAAAEAQAAYDATGARLAAATNARLTAEAELVQLASRDVALTTTIAQRTSDRKAASLRLVAARRAVQEMAVGVYVISGAQSDLTRLIDQEANDRIAAADVLADVVEEDRRAEQDAARALVQQASDDVDAAMRERAEVRDRHVVVSRARDEAASEEAAATAELGVRLHELQQARAVATVRGTDFTLVALDAYVKAAATQARCGIRWWALAGISRVEGRHGTYGGRRLQADGQVDRAIVGIPLNGENNTQAIGDTDDGRLDGDSSVDRAVGPMQFIPSTWARWGRDGDGDGDEDPQNIYDATAAAAAYLCNNRSMADEAGMRAGFFSYNHSEAYVENVLGHARRYSAFRIPDPPPPPPVAPTIP